MQDLRKNVLAWPVPHINEIVPFREKPGENYAWHYPTTLLIIYGGHYSIFNFKVHYCSTEYTSVVVVSRSSLKMHCPKIYFSVSASLPSKGSFSNNLGQAVELRNDIMKKASSNSIESSPISTWPSTSTTTTFWSAMQANYVAVVSNKILLTPVCMALMVYINSLHGDFVHDDIPAIVRNPDVNGQRRKPKEEEPIMS